MPNIIYVTLILLQNNLIVFYCKILDNHINIILCLVELKGINNEKLIKNFN